MQVQRADLAERMLNITSAVAPSAFGEAYASDTSMLNTGGA